MTTAAERWQARYDGNGSFRGQAINTRIVCDNTLIPMPEANRG